MRKRPVFRLGGEVFSSVARHCFQLLFAAWPAAGEDDSVACGFDPASEVCNERILGLNQ